MLPLFFFYPHLRTCLLISERGGGREEGENHRCERDDNWLPPVCILTGDQTWNLGCALTENQNCSLSVYGTMLQPTEPHQPGLMLPIFSILAMLIADRCVLTSYCGFNLHCHLKTTHMPTCACCFTHLLPVLSDSGQTVTRIIFVLLPLLKLLTSFFFFRVQSRPKSLTSLSPKLHSPHSSDIAHSGQTLDFLLRIFGMFLAHTISTPWILQHNPPTQSNTVCYCCTDSFMGKLLTPLSYRLFFFFFFL